MGAICHSEEKRDDHNVPLSTEPEPLVEIPFNQMDINDFLANLAKAESLGSCRKPTGCVTLEAMAACFPEWPSLGNQKNGLSKFLLQRALRGDYHEGEIDVICLKLMAIIHCQGTNMGKAKELYLIFQPEDPHILMDISSDDKDIVPSFSKLCELVLLDCPDAVRPSKSVINTLLEDKLLAPTFGFNDKVKANVWLNAAAKHCSWLFNPDTFRHEISEAIAQ